MENAVDHELAALEIERTEIPRSNETSDRCHPPWVREWLGADINDTGVDYLKLADAGHNIDIKVCVSRHTKITIKPKDLDESYEIFMVINAAKHRRYGYRVKRVWFISREALLPFWNGCTRAYWGKFLDEHNLFQVRSPTHARDLFQLIRWGDASLQLAKKYQEANQCQN